MEFVDVGVTTSPMRKKPKKHIHEAAQKATALNLSDAVSQMCLRAVRISGVIGRRLREGFKVAFLPPLMTYSIL